MMRPGFSCLGVKGRHACRPWLVSETGVWSAAIAALNTSRKSACQPSARVGVHGRAIASIRGSHVSEEGDIRWTSANTRNLLRPS